MNNLKTTHVFFVVHGLFPINGHPVSGNGVRAWGLLQGLMNNGCRITYATPIDVIRDGWEQYATEGLEVVFFDDASELNSLIECFQPDVIVGINWELVDLISEKVSIPLVLDLTAPRLLEIEFENPTHVMNDSEIFRYLNVVSRGDYFLCSTEKQKAFYHSWMLLSGIRASDDPIEIIPVSANPQLPTRVLATSILPTFVYGGVFWPWQRATSYLNRVLAVLEKAGKGQLLVIGGSYPLASDTDSTYQFTDTLADSQYLTVKPLLPYDEMEREFCGAHVAIDLSERNSERELSFSYRIIEYLRCGVPVICNHYLSIAAEIKAYEAGWVINTEDNPAAVEELIQDILSNPAQIETRSENARRLVYELYNWDVTTVPLYQYCAKPKKIDRKKNIMSAVFSRQTKLENQLADQADTLEKQTDRIEELAQHNRDHLDHHLIAITKQLSRIEEQYQTNHVDNQVKIQQLVYAQQHVDHRLSVLANRGVLRWIWRIPERIYRVLIKPLFSRRNEKNIAIITRGDIFPVHHGAAVRIIESARALSHHCDQVFIITTDRTKYYAFFEGEMYEKYYPQFLSIFPLPLNPLIQYFLQHRGVPRNECYLFYPLYDLNMWVRTLFVAYQHRIELYQAEFPAFLRPAVIAKWVFGGKTSLVEHNVEFSRIDETEGLLAKGKQFLRAIEVRLCNQADHVVAVSLIDQKALVAAGVKPEKISVIPHGVDLKSFSDAVPAVVKINDNGTSEASVLVYHGPYSYAPNLQAVTALGRVIIPSLQNRGHHTVCLAIGDSPPGKSPHQSVTFVGPVDNIGSYLKRGDIAVVPLTAGGGTRMKVLDYFAARVPVVATSKAVEGLPVEDGKHLIVVDDIEEMIDPIIELISNPERRRILTDNAFSLVEQLDWSMIGAHYMKVYNFSWWRGNHDL